MTIDIQEPELEALIEQRMASGKYKTAADVVRQALEASTSVPKAIPKQNLADFLLASPLAGSGLVVERSKDSPREIDL